MPKSLYIFIGIHSLLSGFFIFFIPVFLWKLGLNLSNISLFISLTGLSFTFSIYLWDKLKNYKSMNFVILISFILEILLVGTGLFSDKSWFLYVLALLYGIYNCFFWLTQRILFSQGINHNNIGQSFGNIQIIAFILVKIGILIGSYLLEYYNFLYLWIIVSIINIFGIILFYKINNTKKYFSLSQKEYPQGEGLEKSIQTINIKEIFKFKDKYSSKIIFLLDGPFLFFESFFWVISLFFITNQSYTQLGYLTIFLAFSFSVSFYIIKNKIDKYPIKKIYKISVILYALSWFLRGFITNMDSKTLLHITILIIAFSTSFFRLTFNKQFFHITKDTLGEKYIIIKSYYSQVSIFIVFLILSFIFYNSGNNLLYLDIIYYLLSFISLIYLFYKA